MPAIKNVNVLDPYGESFLNGHGIGNAVVNATGQITQINCGIFAVNKPIPTLNKEYVITGDYDDPQPPYKNIPFKATLKCTAPGRPQSTFAK